MVEDFVEFGGYFNELVKLYLFGMVFCLVFVILMLIEFDCFLIDEGMFVGDY